MKDLPPDPPVWTPPPERWFERYRPAADESAATVMKTLCAMWLMLLDRLGEPLPDKARAFGPAERGMFATQFNHIGADAIMSAWRNECSRVKAGSDPAKAFLTLLSKESLDGK